MSSESEELLRSAMIAERAGNLDGAFDMYEAALRLLFESAKTEKNEGKRKILQETITYYLDVAERLKTRIAAQKADSAQPSKPSKPKKKVPEMKPDSYDYSASEKQRRKPQPIFAPDPKIKRSLTPTTDSKRNNATTSLGRSNSFGKATDKQAIKASSGNETKLSEYEEQILSEMLDSSPGVSWSDIAGLHTAKQTLQEAVILPNLRPDLFTGLRAPPKGVLLFGPPGTGKTMLAKAVATESGFAFFSITASSVTSKYLGEGEKLMKALFSVARLRQPSVIFFDEIDAIMSARKENEHEASRRIKTEFMTQIDGAATAREERILIMGATNIPWELDEAVLRRMVKRIYVPLPDYDARKGLIRHLITKHFSSSLKTGEEEDMKKSSSGKSMLSTLTSIISPTKSKDDGVGGLTERDIDRIVTLTDGYSGSDLTAVCHDAAMGPIRELGLAAIRTVQADQVREVAIQDFIAAVSNIRPSVSPESLQAYKQWVDQFGVV